MTLISSKHCVSESHVVMIVHFKSCFELYKDYKCVGCVGWHALFGAISSKLLSGLIKYVVAVVDLFKAAFIFLVVSVVSLEHISLPHLFSSLHIIAGSDSRPIYRMIYRCT